MTQEIEQDKRDEVAAEEFKNSLKSLFVSGDGSTLGNRFKKTFNAISNLKVREIPIEELRKNNNPGKVWTWIIIIPFLAFGLWAVLASFGILPLDTPTNPEETQAPMWLLTCFGIFFISGGLAVMNGYAFKNYSVRLSHFINIFFSGTFATILYYVIFDGRGGTLEGGIPFLPVSVNEQIFKGLLLFFLIILLFMFVRSVYKFINPRGKYSESKKY